MAARPWLKTLRGERTQEEMARHLGINRAYLAQLELNQEGKPKPYLVNRIYFQ